MDDEPATHWELMPLYILVGFGLVAMAAGIAMAVAL